ncbi:MAG: hypothetical protein MI750_09080, partial [Xanthomonadales bacterium]|nr:hypothetical protein [Xanthomonadales bacterium]
SYISNDEFIDQIIDDLAQDFKSIADKEDLAIKKASFKEAFLKGVNRVVDYYHLSSRNYEENGNNENNHLNFSGLYSDQFQSLAGRYEKQTGDRTKEVKELRYLYYTVLALKRRIGAFAGDMGVLSSRCSELLERLNPKQLSSSINKRQDMAFYDHYIKTFCDRSFKDLFIFCKDNEFLGATYPSKDQAPLVIHSTTHKNIAEVKSFLRYEHYEKWRAWILNPSNDETEVKIENPGANALAVLNSFFIEIPTSTPIAVHELAHRVIREFYGKYIRYELLNYENRYGVLGDFLRKYFISMDELHKIFNKGNNDFIHVEILADLLAACRCGPSYLYAWLMEVLPSELLDTVHMVDEFERVSLGSLKRMINDDKLDYYNELPLDYIRGAFVLELTKGVCDLTEDECALELTEGFRSYLHLMLDVRYRANQDLIAEWRRFPSLVRKVLVGSGFLQTAAKFRCFFSNKKSHSTKESTSTPYKAEKSYDFIRAQLLSTDYNNYMQHQYEEYVQGNEVDCISDFKPIFYYRGEAIDLSWRIVWISISSTLKQLSDGFVSRSRDGQQQAENASSVILKLISRFFYFDALAKEDYVAKLSSYQELLHSFTVTSDDLSSSDDQGDIHKKKRITLSIKKREDSSNENSHQIRSDQFISRELRYLGHIENLTKGEESSVYFSFVDDGVGHGPGKENESSLSFNTPIRYSYRLNGAAGEKQDDVEGVTIQKHRMMVLEFRVLSQNTTQNVESRADLLKKDDQYSVDLTTSAPMAEGIVLGTYDHFVLASYQDTAGLVFRNDFYPSMIQKSAYVRRRSIMPISTDAFPSKEKFTIIGFILIGLKSHSLRWLFLAWLEDNKNTVLGGVKIYDFIGGIFFSQGWEDIVLAIKPPNTSTDRGDKSEYCDIYYNSLLNFVTQMAEHPIVTTTDTVFTERIYAEKPRSLVSKFRICVDRYSHFVNHFKEEFESEIIEGKLSLIITSGYFDYEVTVNASSDEIVKDIWKRLAETKGVDRIVTDVGFYCPRVHPNFCGYSIEND